MPDLIEPTPEQISAAEAKLASLRDMVANGPTSLADAARVLGLNDAGLMAMLTLHELRQRPGSAAMIASADGVAVVKPAGEDVTITVPPLLAMMLIEGLLAGDPSADIKLCAPFPASAGSQEIQ